MGAILRRFHYALNICDLAGVVRGGPAAELVVPMLLAPVTKSRQIVRCERGRVDGDGILLECGDERAEAIIFVLRKRWPDKWRPRFYHSKSGKGGWTRVVNPAVEKETQP